MLIRWKMYLQSEWRSCLAVYLKILNIAKGWPSATQSVNSAARWLRCREDSGTSFGEERKGEKYKRHDVRDKSAGVIDTFASQKKLETIPWGTSNLARLDATSPSLRDFFTFFARFYSRDGHGAAFSDGNTKCGEKMDEDEGSNTSEWGKNISKETYIVKMSFEETKNGSVS